MRSKTIRRRTSVEFDTAGRLKHSAFAQSSANSSYPFYPDFANPSAAKATRRAHVVCDYLPSGQLDEVFMPCILIEPSWARIRRNNPVQKSPVNYA